MKKLLLTGLLLLLSCAISGSPIKKPLAADQAFVVSAQLFGNDTILINWKIAPKHYLYRERFHFSVLAPKNAAIGGIILPAGEPKEDQIFGKYQVYPQAVTIPVPIINADPKNTQLQVSFQGCSEDGYCYPPMAHVIKADFASRSVTIDAADSSADLSADSAAPAQQNVQQARFVNLLQGQHLFTIALAFLGFGVLLAFTPCVLPMLPILSGIILGHKEKITTGKAFRLSLTYVLSMAFTYAIAGILVGMLGSSIQTAFQKPWVIGLFSLLFVLLALSFFGFYQIRMPAKLEEGIANISRHQKSGHYISVAVMGCLATLIISPCVTPALVGVLTYIGQTGKASLGGVALFSLAFGMGLPLIVAGTAGGKLLPKAGHWMKTLESVFGVIFLGLAIWMLDRILPAQLTLLLWALLFLISAIYLGALSTTPESGWGKLWKGCGLISLVYGTLMLVGVALGNSNPLQPLQINRTNIGVPGTSSNQGQLFTRVANLASVQQAIAVAKQQHRPVVLDFYADWCISCKEMERATLQDPQVRTALQQVVALQADITANNYEDKALMQHFQVIAPPTMLFFDANGQWLPNLTLVGKIDAPELRAQLDSLAAPKV